MLRAVELVLGELYGNLNDFGTISDATLQYIPTSNESVIAWLVMLLASIIGIIFQQIYSRAQARAKT